MAEETGGTGGSGIGIEQRIRLVIDEEAAKRAEAQAAETGQKIAANIASGGEPAGEEFAQGFQAGVKATVPAADKAARDAKGKFTKVGQEIGAELPPPVLSAWERIKAAGRSSAQAVAGFWRKATTDMRGWFNETAKGMLTAFTVDRAIRGAFDFGKELFKLSTDLGETESKFQTTFGVMAKQVDDFNLKWGRLAGLSRNNAREMTATAGAIVQGMGASEEASAQFAERMLRLAGDLTSFHNVPLADSFTAIKSALAGAWEPLDRFGIVIRQDAVDTRAMADTGKRTAGELTSLDKAMAALALAAERAGPAIGDLERTQKSNGNQVRQLAADYQNWKEQLAKDITPQVTELIGWLNENKDAITGLANALVWLTGHVGMGIVNWFTNLSNAISTDLLRAWAEWNRFMEETMRIGAGVLDVLGGIADFFGQDDLAARLRERGKALHQNAEEWKLWAAAVEDSIDEAEHAARRKAGLEANPPGVKDTRGDTFGMGGGVSWEDAAGAGTPTPGKSPPRTKTAAQIRAEQAAAAKAREAADRAANKALEDRIERLATATRFENTSGKAVAELQKLEARLTKELTTQNLTLDQTIEKSSQLAKVREALGQEKAPKPLALMTTEERVQFASPLLDVPSIRRQAQDILKGVNAELEVKLVLAGDNIEKAAPILAQMQQVQELLSKPIENRSVDERLDLLERMNQVDRLRAGTTRELLALEKQLSQEVNDQTTTDKERLTAAERLNRVRAMMDVRIDVLSQALNIEHTRIDAAKELAAMEARVNEQLRSQTLTLDEHVAAQNRLARIRAAQDARVDMLTRALAFEETRTKAAAELRQVEADTLKQLQGQRASLEDQLVLKQRLATVRANIGTGDQDVERLRRAEITLQRELEEAQVSQNRVAIQMAADRLDAVRTEITERQRGVAALRNEEKALGRALSDQTGELSRQAAIAAEMVRLKERLATIRVRLETGGQDIEQLKRQEMDLARQRADAEAAGDEAAKQRLDQRLAVLHTDIQARQAAAADLKTEEESILATLEAQGKAMAEQVRLRERLSQVRVKRQAADQDVGRLERQAADTQGQLDRAKDPKERRRLEDQLAQVQAELAIRQRAAEALRREEDATAAALTGETMSLAEQVRLKQRLADIKVGIDAGTKDVVRLEGEEKTTQAQVAVTTDPAEKARLQARLDAIRAEREERQRSTEALKKEEQDTLDALNRQTADLAEQVRLKEKLARIRADLDMAPGGQGARLEQAERKVDIPGRKAEGIEELRRIETEITDQLKNQNLEIEERLRLEERLARVRKTLDEGGNRGLPEAQKGIEILVKPIASVFDEISKMHIPGLDWLDDLLEGLGKTLPAAAETAAQVLMDTMGHALDLLLEGTFTLKGAFGTLGKDMAKGILSEIGKMAKGKALENIAWAIEEGAMAIKDAATLNFPGAAAHGLAALKFGLAAAKWGAVAGGVGAIGGGGGGSSVGSTNSRIGAESADKNKREKGLVVIKGGLINTDDDRQMDALMEAIERLRDYDVEVRRG